jgi:hypothetical protein
VGGWSICQSQSLIEAACTRTRTSRSFGAPFDVSYFEHVGRTVSVAHQRFHRPFVLQQVSVM